MRQNLLLLALAAAGIAAAEDVLYSSRMSKRGLDSEGNFNMCMPHLPPSNLPMLTCP